MTAVEMAENLEAKSKGFSVDWLVKGTLTKVGDILDRLTGRKWKPSSSLATSGIIDRMKRLMDAEVRKDEHGRGYVPHNIQLKMQWDKFSTDSQESLRTLENELLVAAVDHINDRHYYTYSPLSITIKPDYFTEGVVLLAGFDKLDSEESEAAINVTVDGLRKEDLLPELEREQQSLDLDVNFQARGKSVSKTIHLEEGSRISIGRTKENLLQIDDESISKAHASLLLDKEGKLLVADTGSTNGTFVNGQRIAYGKAVEVTPGGALMFGLVNVSVHFEIPQSAVKTQVLTANGESYKVGDFEFSSRSASEPLAPTLPSIPVNKPTIPAPVADDPYVGGSSAGSAAPQSAQRAPEVGTPETGSEPKK